MNPEEITSLTSSVLHQQTVTELLQTLESGEDLTTWAQSAKENLLRQASENKQKLEESNQVFNTEEDELDSLVHDYKSDEGSDINNAGVDAQKTYLIVECGKTLKD